MDGDKIADKHNQTQFNEISFTPDGSRFILSSNQGTLIVLDSSNLGVRQEESEAAPALLDWRALGTIHAHTATVFCIKCDPSGRFAISGGVDSMVGLWSLNDFSSLGMNTGLTASIRSVDFTGDGEFVAVGGEDPNIDIVRAASDDCDTGAVTDFVTSISSRRRHSARFTRFPFCQSIRLSLGIRGGILWRTRATPRREAYMYTAFSNRSHLYHRHHDKRTTINAESLLMMKLCWQSVQMTRWSNV